MWYNKESLRLLIIGDEKMVKDIFELIEKEKKRQEDRVISTFRRLKFN